MRYDDDYNQDYNQQEENQQSASDSGNYRYRGADLYSSSEETASKTPEAWSGSPAYSPTSGSLEAEKKNTSKDSHSNGGGKTPKRRGWGVVKAACLLLAVAVVGGGTGGIVSQSVISNWESSQAQEASAQADTDSSDTQNTTASNTATPTSASSGKLSGEEIYNMALDQVVGITTEITSTNVFDQASTSTVSGTGFILSSDGYILTNYHVIDGGTQITVRLSDNSVYEATLVGGESSSSDMAVLKIEAEGLNAVTIGSSEDLKVGQTVYAVGNPLGELTYTITSGIVSALDREIAVDENTTLNMFQIDAAVNSGNSGGPVYNEYGEVVGIVTAKTNLSGVEGIGFCVPIDDAMNYASQLIEVGYIVKPYMGIYPVTISESYAYYYNTVVGVFVNTVYEGTAAEKAGLQAGDIITGLDDYEIATAEGLQSALGRYSPGDTVTLTVYRDQEYIQIELTLDTTPTEEELSDIQADTEVTEDQYNSDSNQFGGGQFGPGQMN